MPTHGEGHLRPEPPHLLLPRLRKVRPHATPTSLATASSWWLLVFSILCPLGPSPVSSLELSSPAAEVACLLRAIWATQEEKPWVNTASTQTGWQTLPEHWTTPVVSLRGWGTETIPSDAPHLSVQSPLIQLVRCSDPAPDLGGLLSRLKGIFCWQSSSQLLGLGGQSQVRPSPPAPPSPNHLNLLSSPTLHGPDVPETLEIKNSRNQEQLVLLPSSSQHATVVF